MFDRPRRRLLAAACIAGVAALATASVTAADGAGSSHAGQRTYVVLYDQGADPATARAAIAAAGGTVVSENTDIGVATVRAGRTGFVRAVRARRGVRGAARQRSIGRAPALRRKHDDVEDRGRGGRPGPGRGSAAAARRRPSRSPTASGTWRRSAPARTARTASSRATAASGSGSSTPASTARTRTSRRTSTAG
jgi:hypothetical protein